MRYALAAALLLACSSSATVPSGDGGDAAATDARGPTDENLYPICLEEYSAACTMPSGTAGERLVSAAAALACLNRFDVPETVRETWRVCLCVSVGAQTPANADIAAGRIIRAACCGRTPTIASAWCPDAG